MVFVDGLHASWAVAFCQCTYLHICSHSSLFWAARESDQEGEDLAKPEFPGLWEENAQRVMGHYQTERGAGSEPIPQWRMGSFRGTNFERGQQAKMLQQCNCCGPGCTNSHNRSGAAFLLGICFAILLVLSVQTIPSASALLIPTQFSTDLVMANCVTQRSCSDRDHDLLIQFHT